MSKDSSLYEHIDASKVGNFTRTTVSELAGRASVITKAEEYGISINNDEAKDLIQQVQNLSLIHISEPTRRRGISYAVFCLKKKKRQ